MRPHSANTTNRLGVGKTVFVRLWTNLRNRIRRDDDPMVCRVAVELVTEYLEGALGEPTRSRFERHLSSCDACVRYVEQMRHTSAVLGHVHVEPPEGETRQALIEAFRNFPRD